MGRYIPSDRVGYGINPDRGIWRDDKFVRCNHCGFINHFDRNRRGVRGSREGSGVTISAAAMFDDKRVGFDSSEVTSSTITIQNVHFDGYWIGGHDSDRTSIHGGCSMCGTLLYFE